MDKYQNKYRKESHRMPKWDYSGNGIYFITLVTQHRECNLGDIYNHKMQLSDWGNIVNNELLYSFEIRKELFLDEYVIMPNHLHALIILNTTDDGIIIRRQGLGGTHGADGADGADGTDGTRGADGLDGADGTRGTRGLDGTHGAGGAHGTHVETHGRASLQSNVPQSTVPQSNVPQSNVPQSNVPQSNVPQFNVPQPNVPQPNVAQSNVPQFNVPQFNVPQSIAPQSKTARSNTAQSNSYRPPGSPKTFNQAFIRKSKSISSFIAGFKAAVNSKIDDYIDQNNLNIPKYNRNNHFFQPNYHDHIVRNQQEYYRIKNYIKKNPSKWFTDTFLNKKST